MGKSQHFNRGYVSVLCPAHFLCELCGQEQIKRESG
jgi:hypothetical protein